MRELSEDELRHISGGISFHGYASSCTNGIIGGALAGGWSGLGGAALGAVGGAVSGGGFGGGSPGSGSLGQVSDIVAP